MPKAKKTEIVRNIKPTLASVRNIKLTLGGVRNIKLTLEYDGTDFFGFQRQPNQLTIQQAIEEALQALFQEKVQLASASSRTDAGVHAEEQIIHFKTSNLLPLHRIERGLNHFLPKTISVIKAEEVSESFHARFQPLSKIYEYRVWNYFSHPALWRNRACHVAGDLDLVAMKLAAQAFVGKHDFRAFTSVEKMVKSSSVPRKKISFVRTIKKFSIRRQGKMIVFLVEADGFLYHMVRNLVGTLVAVGKGKLRAEDIPRIIKSHDRKLSGPTLAACGLTLKRVIYPQG